MTNLGYDQTEIDKVKQEIKASKHLFIWNEEEELDENYGHFFFVGKHKGKEVIFDAFLYTLEMEYATKSFDVAMNLLLNRFPEFADADFEAEEGEHIEQFEVTLMEVEEEGLARVTESIDFDEEAGYGVGINVCLNVQEVTPEVINNFIKNFNNDQVNLDKTEYDFEIGEE
ncbi:MAG: hypothetical protein ACPGJS_03900 [Flammeovirgaceae bacterium]